MASQAQSQPTWTDVKAKLASFDRKGLLGLIQDLYAAHKDLKAKKAITDYKKAIADAAGLAELMVFYCEEASGLTSDLCYQDESYFDALVRMFNQAVATANRLPVGSRDALIVRLDRVRSISHKLGYGVGDDMDSIFAKYTKRKA